MKKIFSLVLTLIMLATLFSACDSRNNENGGTTQNPSISDLFGNYTEDPVWVYQSATPIPELSGKTHLTDLIYGNSSAIEVFYIEGETKIDFFFYNVKTGSIVLTKNAIDQHDFFTVEFFTVNDNEFFSLIHGVRNATDYDFSTTVYNANGTQIAYAEGIHAYTDTFLGNLEDYELVGLDYDRVDRVADLLRFDNTIYKIAADGTATILKEKSPFTIDLPDIEFYNEKYYIAAVDLEGFGTATGYVFYNTSLEVVSSWVPKYRNSSTSVCILNNGSLLVQNPEVLPDDAQEYDVFTDGVKYNLTTLLVDPATGTEKSIEASFVALWVYPIDSDYWEGSGIIRDEFGYSDEYENLAHIQYIKDKKATGTLSLVILDNEGNIVCEPFTNLPQLDLESSYAGFGVEPIAENIFCYNTIQGTTVYINANGEKLLETNASFSYSFGNYFVVDDAIYDKSFNLVYDFGADGYELMSRDWSYELPSISAYDSVMSDSILLTKYDAVYLFINDTPTLIIENGAGDRLYDVTNDYYVVRKPSQNSDYLYSYHYYNARGQFLFTSYGSTASRILSDDGIALFRAYNVEGNAYYYRVTK